MISTTVRVGSESFALWTAKHPDRLLEALAEKAPDHPDVLDERLPYWAELWPSARVLAEAVLTVDSRPEGPWLELGCGPGLPGLAACRRGSRGIWSDYMPEALTLAAWNAQCAGIDSPATQLIDWRNPPDALRVSWILAADVAYEERNFLPLLESFNRLLAPGGEVWLSEPGRPVAKTFFDMLSTEDWLRKNILQVGEVSVWRLQRKKDVLP
ncbi:MAG: protein N-lysine methyltransferase family protein [Kiritimatiellae bacterium]|nr:protein N-lysine methyltransferase family protein [Kiritimatiellia bacterium]